jgi:hypothetical protein
MMKNEGSQYERKHLITKNSAAHQYLPEKKKEKSRIPLKWKLCGSTVSNSSAISGMHLKSFDSAD